MQKIDKSYRRRISVILDNVIPISVIKKNNAKKLWKYGRNEEYDVIVISRNGTIGQIVEISGLKIALPSAPKKIRFKEFPNNEQKWARYTIPEELLDFDKIYKDEPNPVAKWKQVQLKYKSFIEEDIERKFNGDWICIDGEDVYLTGYYYFFLQHYYLSDMRKFPDFRNPQLDYFIFVEACFADFKCLGSLLLKSRRSSFSTTSASIVLCKAITYINGFFPIVSKKDKDAETLFNNHIVKPFLALPKHLQPQRSGEVMPKKELSFASVKKRLTTNNKLDTSDVGLDTLITYYATTVDAYDGTQVTISINDEIGKLKGNLDINEYWEQAHKMCHVVGSQVVGKALCGSTANPPNKGGKNYAKFYNDSKHSNKNGLGLTSTDLYAIFIPADFTTMGFFDQWGYTIYNDPDVPIKNELGLMVSIGAKRYLDEKEAICQGDIKKLNAQKRNNPRVDNDAFLDEEASSIYGREGVINHVNFLKTFINTDKYKNQVFRFDLYYKPTVDNPLNVEISHSAKGRYMASWLPPIELRNKYKIKDGKRYPVNGHLGALGADPYQADRVKHGGGSKMGIVGITSSDVETLLKYQRNLTFVFYNNRPDTVEEAEDDAMKLALYLSMPILIETNKDGLVKRFYRDGLRGYSLNDPLRKKSEMSSTNTKYGGISTTAYNKGKQEQSLETYLHDNVNNDVDENDIKIPFLALNEMAIEYSETTRTKLDGVVAWMLASLALSKKDIVKEKIEDTETQYIRIIDLFKTNTTNNDLYR